MKKQFEDGFPGKYIDDVVACVLVNEDVRRATAFISAKQIVRATAQYRIDGRCSRATILLTIGQPNFVERRFIRLAKKAGEPFPIKKIQLKFWPKKKK